MIETLVEILKKVDPTIPTDGIGPDTRFAEDLELDSLLMMLLAVNTEDEFGLRFGDVNVFETVGQLCEYIEKNRTK